MLDLKKASIVGIILSSALALSGCNLYRTSGTDGTAPQNQQQTGSQSQAAPGAGGISINITDEGFVPSLLIVKSGDSLTWVNKSSKKVQVGSDNHPTHTLNSELTNGQFTIELAPEESATVTLTKTGNWGYHDHLTPSTKGTVSVQ